MEQLFQQLERRYLEVMIEQSEKIGYLQERLDSLERRLGYGDGSVRSCKIVKLAINQQSIYVSWSTPDDFLSPGRFFPPFLFGRVRNSS